MTGVKTTGMSQADATKVLAGVELFAGLGPPVLSALAAAAVPRSYPKGSLLFTEGDQGGSLLVLTSGAVTIFRTSSAGDRAVLAVLRPPEVLGELALLDGAPRSASAEAMSATTVLSVGRDAFLGLIRAQPALLDPLLRHLGAMVRRLSDQTTDYVFLDLAGRVAKVLIRLADAELPTPRPPTVEVTQGRLAEMAGGSRQSVNQVLGAFATRGLVRIEGRRILIMNTAALRRRAGLPTQSVAVTPTRPGAGRGPGPVRGAGAAVRQPGPVRLPD
jgi:CRP-like cAMP-binding protein